MQEIGILLTQQDGPSSDMPQSDDENISRKPTIAYLPRTAYQSVKQNSKPSMPWRLHDGQNRNFEAFSPKQIERISISHGLDQEAVRALSKSIGDALREDLRILRVETIGERANKGAQEIKKAIKKIQSLQHQLKEVEETLSNLEFGDVVISRGRPETSFEHQAYCQDAAKAFDKLAVHLADMATSNKVMFNGTPDKRRMRDLRRGFICNSIFTEWKAAGRSVSSTTNPVTGKREGPLIALVNDVVALVTEPSTHLSGETIHSEILRFKSTKPIGRSA